MDAITTSGGVIFIFVIILKEEKNILNSINNMF